MRALTKEQQTAIQGGGKFCDFAAGASIGAGALALIGAPVPGGRVLAGALLATDIYCQVVSS